MRENGRREVMGIGDKVVGGKNIHTYKSVSCNMHLNNVRLYSYFKYSFKCLG